MCLDGAATELLLPLTYFIPLENSNLISNSLLNAQAVADQSKQ